MTELEKFVEGQRVVLEDGRQGRLSNPRGCFCGPKGEACWDISLDDGFGVQAHGGSFSQVKACIFLSEDASEAP